MRCERCRIEMEPGEAHELLENFWFTGCRIIKPGAIAGEWRQGRKVGRTLYLDGKLVGLMDTPELAKLVVEALKRGAP